MKEIDDLITKYESKKAGMQDLILKAELTLRTEIAERRKEKLTAFCEILTDLKNINGLSVKRNVLIDFMKWYNRDGSDPYFDIQEYEIDEYQNQVKP